MQNNNTEIKNINGELQGEQKAVVERAKEIMALLDKEPAMALEPFLRSTYRGILPDIRLVIKPIENESADKASGTDGGDETVDTEPSTDSVGESTGGQPDETEDTAQ